MNCKHCNVDTNKVIYTSKQWNLVFHKQDYLGRCILSTIRHVDNFSKLTDEEVIDLRNLLNSIEVTLKKLYGCTMLNWCCNMNNVYSRIDTPNPHVHIHVRPRYQNTVNINNVDYKDKEFGEHYDRFAPIQFDSETINIIFESFKSEFLNSI